MSRFTGKSIDFEVYPPMRVHNSVPEWIETVRAAEGDKFANRCAEIMDPSTDLEHSRDRQIETLKFVAREQNVKLPVEL